MDERKAFAALARVVQPGGLIAVSDFALETSAWPWERWVIGIATGGKDQPIAAAYRVAAASAGLDVQKYEETQMRTFVPTIAAVLQPPWRERLLPLVGAS